MMTIIYVAVGSFLLGAVSMAICIREEKRAKGE